MDALRNPYDGIRPSDLRYDNVHILAEYIARAQNFADNATKIQTASEQLAHVVIKTAEDGCIQFQTLKEQMHSEFKVLQSQLSLAVIAAGGEITKTVADVYFSGERYIDMAGQIAKKRYDGLESRVDEISNAVKQLVQISKRIEASHRRAIEEFEQLRVVKTELEGFERDSLRRIHVAKVKLYKGARWWQRLWYVLVPPNPTLDEAKKPNRQSPQHPEAGRPNIPPNQINRDGGSTGVIAPFGNGQKK